MDNVGEETEHAKKYNDRVPSMLKSNELSEKMFSKGWKFDLFNMTGQTCKVIAAASVIFAQLYFSLAGMIMQESVFATTVFAYSSICLFSFLNVSYVRDFDVIQCNITPVVLAIIGMTLTKGFDFV